MTTVALIAAKDAAASIAPTVRAVRMLRGIDEVWVVDDGSADTTAAVASGAGAHVVRLGENVGKGGALAAGAQATTHADRYLLADADLGATASGLQPLLDASPAALAVGVLPSAGSRGGFGSVKRLAAIGIRRAVQLELQAPLSGQRCIDGALFRSLVLAPRFGVEVGMTIDVARRDVEVVEIPIEVDHHHTGRSLAGFRHRGRQGADIIAALGPRLLSVRAQMAAVVIFGLVAVLGLSALSWVRSAPRGDAFPQADRVVLFSFDHLGLSDLTRTDLPGLRAAATDGVAGALSVRTTDRRSLDRRSGPERPSAVDAYASLGASARVRGVPGLAVAPEAGTGLAMKASRALGVHDKAASLPGALGDQLHRAGKRTALVAGAQLVDGRATAGFPAAAAIADRHGRIDHVDVSSGLLEATTDPTRVRASVPSFVIGTVAALRAADVVLIDPGETARAAGLGADRREAMRRTDALLRSVRGVLPPRTMLVVFSPTPPDSAWELTPIVVVDTGEARGQIASSSTHRAGMAVLTDLAPTVLDAVGAAPSNAMTGAELRRAGGSFAADRFERLTIDGAVRNRFFLRAAVGYTVAAIVFYLLLVAVILTKQADTAGAGLRGAALAAGAFPLALLVTGAMQHCLHVGGESPVLLVVLCAALGAATTRWRNLSGVYAFAAACVMVIAVDVAATGPIHTASLLGYTLQTSGRFYGLPNASFSVFAASLLLVAIAVAGGVRRATPVRALAGTTVLLVGVAFVAAPWLGNDVGGTLALAPVAAALAWGFFGGRFTLRTAITGGLVVLVGVAALLALEAVFGAGTHLSRAASGGSIRTALEHRMDVNVGLLVDQWWGFLVFLLALFGLYTTQRGYGEEELPLGSPLRMGFAGVLALSLLAFLANDSGPVVSVLCLVVVAPVVALRAIDASRRRLSRR